MGHFSKVLYALEHTIEPTGFEALCVDLLCREGFVRIVPGGRTRDLGRDAETRYWTEENKLRPSVAFQFSMEKKWEAKLRREVTKILNHCNTIERVVFVTNQPVTNEKQEKLRAELESSNSISLSIYEREWFRVRLEEVHLDLTKKHLGVELEVTPSFHARRVVALGLRYETKDELLEGTTVEDLKATFSKQVKADPSNRDAWKGLADVEFFTANYNEALRAVKKAIELSFDDLDRFNLEAAKNMILAEKGIRENSQALLLRVKKSYQRTLERLRRSVDYYNLANVAAGLGDHDFAVPHYERALEMEPSNPQYWHNLGTSLLKTKRKNEGLAAYNKALDLDPNLVEALITKGNVLVMTGGKSQEALKCFERAKQLEPEAVSRWRHLHYWNSLALCQEKRFEDALTDANEGLELHPDCEYLTRLACDIYAELWPGEPKVRDEAQDFFETLLGSDLFGHSAAGQLLKIAEETKEPDKSWQTIRILWGVSDLPVKKICKRANIFPSDISESLPVVDEYQSYRKVSRLVDYGKMLHEAGLECHNEVPEVLWRLWQVSFHRLSVTFRESTGDGNLKFRKKAIVQNLAQIARTFGALGGWLASNSPPNHLGVDEISSSLTNSLLQGADIVLMETARQLGYVLSSLEEELSDDFHNLMIDSFPEAQRLFLEVFFEAIWDDWEIERLRESKPD